MGDSASQETKICVKKDAKNEKWFDINVYLQPNSRRLHQGYGIVLGGKKNLKNLNELPEGKNIQYRGKY